MKARGCALLLVLAAFGIVVAGLSQCSSSWLNEVYARLRDRLDPYRRSTLQREESQWLLRLNAVPVSDPRRVEMIKRRTEELLRWTN